MMTRLSLYLPIFLLLTFGSAWFHLSERGDPGTGSIVLSQKAQRPFEFPMIPEWSIRLPTIPSMSWDWLGLMMGGMLFAAPVVLIRFDTWLRYNISRFGAHHPDEHVLRSSFSDLPKPPTPRERDNHTHGIAAGWRKAAIGLIETLALTSGRVIHSGSMSSSDQRKGFRGDRPYFWAKDLKVLPRNDDLLPNSLWTLIDVDYHMDDLPEILAKHSLPTVLYTVAPTKSASSDGNTSYCFDSDGNFCARVSGNANYTHKLWSYSEDNFSVASSFNLFFTRLVWKRVHYLCEVRHLTHFQAIVLLVPTVTFYGPFAWLSNRYLKCNSMQRFNPVIGDHVVIHVKTKTSSFISVGRVGGFDSATVPAPIVEAMYLAADNAKVDMTLASIRSWLPDGEESRLEAAYLLSLYKARKKGQRLVTVSPVHLSDRSYSCNVQAYGDSLEKPSVVAFMSPFDNRAFNPTKCSENERWAVDSRVIKLIAKNKTLHAPKPELIGYMGEYVRQITKGLDLNPCEVEDVIANQKTGKQKAALSIFAETFARIRLKVSAFLKREAYGEVKDPRIITQFDVSMKLEYARFILPLMPRLQELDFYGFKTPLQITDQIEKIGKRAEIIIESDYKRFDGTVTEFVRRYHDAPLLHAAYPRYREAVDEAYHHQWNNKVYMSNDLSFESGATQSSGSMDTAAQNTSRNVSMFYIALRIYGMTHEEAWNYLCAMGCFGGDDGVFGCGRGLDRKRFIEILGSVVASWGFVLDITIRERNEPFTFLARYWNSWKGSRQSMCDVKRQVPKFHVSVHSPSAPLTKLREKCHAFYLTDRNTPIIGDIATAVIKRHGALDGVSGEVSTWWSQYKLDEQFENLREDWMEEVVLRTYPEFNRTTLQGYLDALENGETSGLDAPLCVEPELERTATKVVMDGDITLLEKTSKDARTHIDDDGREPEPREDDPPVSKRRASTKPDDGQDTQCLSHRQRARVTASTKPKGRPSCGTKVVKAVDSPAKRRGRHPSTNTANVNGMAQARPAARKDPQSTRSTTSRRKTGVSPKKA